MFDKLDLSIHDAVEELDPQVHTPVVDGVVVKKGFLVLDAQVEIILSRLAIFGCDGFTGENKKECIARIKAFSLNEKISQIK